MMVVILKKENIIFFEFSTKTKGLKGMNPHLL